MSQAYSGSESDEQYVKLTHREHILVRPDSYVGSIEPHDDKMWIANEDGEFEEKNITYIPGLYKIFDEILVNAADNSQREPPLKNIWVEINQEQNKISVKNDGRGITLVDQYDKIDDKYYPTPQFIFSQLLTSSNYSDEQEKVTGGRNGYGAKLTNIFSTKFILDLVNKEEKKKYHQEFANNMLEIGEPEITPLTKKPASSTTQITFYPDLARFKLKDGITNDMVGLMRRRVYDLAGILDNVNVFLNGKKLEIGAPVEGKKKTENKKWEDYCRKYIGPEANFIQTTVTNAAGRQWKIGIAPSKGSFKQVSFVNSVATAYGGTHVDLVVNQVTKWICETLKSARSKVDVKPAVAKNYLNVFVCSLVVNPAFDSQTKERLTVDMKKLKDECILDDKFLQRLKKIEILEYIKEFVAFKEQSKMNRMGGKKRGRLNIKKLVDANEAGRAGSKSCTLILTEGDSAKGMAVCGLATVGSDYFGVFPLRGKMLNTRDTSITKITKNKEIENVMKIVGLEPGKTYEDGIDSLRYGHIMIMADQDVDGSHIKGLFINFIHSMWPLLLKKYDFVCEFVTPIVKATKGKGKKMTSIPFFNLPDFVKWKESNNGGKGYNIKYYKGLATSTPAETTEYFKDYKSHKVDFARLQTAEEERISLAFAKKRADDRKMWLAEADSNEQYSGLKSNKITIGDFIDKELILFSSYANVRAIPSVVDGLKPGQRKILWVCLKNNIRSDLKVAQLSGKVSELSAYHHGEQSLNMTIIGMAQDFVGSNNINLLKPKGHFGTRDQGGQDSGAPRYVFTCLTKIARTLFRKEDDFVLKYLADDGQPIEPAFYVPVIPMVLVNGAKGIGVGWSTDIPQFNPVDIIENIKRKLKGEPMVEMIPWYSGFTGQITPVSVKPNEDGTIPMATKWDVIGTAKQLDETTIEITELPVGVWTEDYRTFLNGLRDGEVRNPKNRIGDTKDNKKKKAAPKKTVEKKKPTTRKKKTDAATDDGEPAPTEDDEPEPVYDPNARKIQDMRAHQIKDGVYFEVTVDDKQMGEIQSVGINQYFKLTDTINASNMTLFGSDGKIRQYKNALEIIDDFYKVRLDYYDQRIRFMIEGVQINLKRLSNQARFIKMFVEGKLELRNIPKRQILLNLREKGFDFYDPKELEKRIKISAEAIIKDENENEEEEENEDKPEDVAAMEKGYDYLLSMKLWSLTKERYNKLMNEHEEEQKHLEELMKTKPEELYLKELEEAEVACKEFEKHRADVRKESLAEGLATKNSNKKRKRPAPKRKTVPKKIKEEDDDEDAFIKEAAKKIDVKKSDSRVKVKTEPAPPKEEKPKVKAEPKPKAKAEPKPKAAPKKGSSLFEDEDSEDEMEFSDDEDEVKEVKPTKIATRARPKKNITDFFKKDSSESSSESEDDDSDDFEDDD